MTSIVTVVTAAPTKDLTVLDRVKSELGLTDGSNDSLLVDLIHEESEKFADLVNRTLASETVIEEFDGRHLMRPGVLALTRYPVTAIASVTENDDPTALDTSLYEVDAAAGLLSRFNDSGNLYTWTARKIVVAYTGGYTLLDTLPRQIETAVLALIRGRWFARSRDPSIKSRTIVDVGSWTYAVGPVPGSAGGSLPLEVQDAVDTYRSIPI